MKNSLSLQARQSAGPVFFESIASGRVVSLCFYFSFPVFWNICGEKAKNNDAEKPSAIKWGFSNREAAQRRCEAL